MLLSFKFFNFDDRSIDGFEESDDKSFKEELELPIILLALWYCEPIDVKHETDNGE